MNSPMPTAAGSYQHPSTVLACRPRWGNENRLGPGSSPAGGGGPAVDPGLLQQQTATQQSMQQSVDGLDGSSPPPEPAWHQTTARWFGELQYKVGAEARLLRCTDVPATVVSALQPTLPLFHDSILTD